MDWADNSRHLLRCWRTLRWPISHQTDLLKERVGAETGERNAWKPAWEKTDLLPDRGLRRVIRRRTGQRNAATKSQQQQGWQWETTRPIDSICEYRFPHCCAPGAALSEAVPTTLLASVCLLHGVATRAATFSVIGSPKSGVRLDCEATHPSERHRAEIWSCSLAFWLSWSLFRKRNSSPGSKYKEHLSERGRTVVSRHCGGNFSVWETSYCIMSWIVYIYSCQQGFYHTENVFYCTSVF